MILFLVQEISPLLLKETGPDQQGNQSNQIFNAESG